MSSLSKRINKKTGTIYVYHVESYWDKEKKAPRNKQTYLGKEDPETGEIIPTSRRKPRAGKKTVSGKGPACFSVPEEPTTTSKAVPGEDICTPSDPVIPPAVAKTVPGEGVAATSRVAGPYLVISKAAEDTGLAACVKQVFPDLHLAIMSLVYFCVQKGLALSRSEFWSQGHLHPAGTPFSNQRISELLLKITEDDRQRFFSLWLKHVCGKEYLYYDITSISSYATANAYVRYGYNRDGEDLEQVNMGLVFGQDSGLPVYYRRLPGNISDVSTLRTTLKSMDFLDPQKMRLMLDRGFYSNDNVDALLSNRHHFTMGVPINRKWVMEALDLHCEAIASPRNYRQINDNEALFMVTERIQWKKTNRRVYLHIYYNAARAAEAYDRFTRKLLKLKKTIEEKGADALSPADARFFIITQTPKRGLKVEFNDAEIQTYRKRYAGFFCILSTHLKDPQEALSAYRRKDAVENAFDDLKNQLDMKRLRVHTSAAMDSRIFLQFLALILISAIRKTAKNTDTIKNMTVREIMEAMETLVQIKYEHR